MCYGNCPVYNVTVDKEGNVKYEGDMFVYKSGEYRWKIPSKKVKQLSDLIENFGFKSFIYKPLNGFVTDQPSCITTVKYFDGDSKEIDHYYGDILLDDRLTDLMIFSYFFFCLPSRIKTVKTLKSSYLSHINLPLSLSSYPCSFPTFLPAFLKNFIFGWKMRG